MALSAYNTWSIHWSVVKYTQTEFITLHWIKTFNISNTAKTILKLITVKIEKKFQKLDLDIPLTLIV